MAKSQNLGVQSMPSQARGDGSPGGRSTQAAIHGIADDRQPEQAAVHADLVGSAGLETKPQQRTRGAQCLDNFEMGYCFAAFIDMRRESAPVSGVAPVAGSQRSGLPLGHTQDDPQVTAAQAVLPELHGEALLCASRSGHDDQPTRIAVEAMNDPRTDRLVAG